MVRIRPGWIVRGAETDGAACCERRAARWRQACRSAWLRRVVLPALQARSSTLHHAEPAPLAQPVQPRSGVARPVPPRAPPLRCPDPRRGLGGGVQGGLRWLRRAACAGAVGFGRRRSLALLAFKPSVLEPGAQQEACHLPPQGPACGPDAEAGAGAGAGAEPPVTPPPSPSALAAWRWAMVRAGLH